MSRLTSALCFFLAMASCRALDQCAPESMARCTDPLKVVTDNKDLGFATSIEELDKMCPKLMDGLRCIDDFTFRCLDEEHRRYFNTLYQGTTKVIIDLCQEGDYQTAYLRHAPCMRQVQNGYESCADDYQVKIKSLKNDGEGGNSDESEEEEDVNLQLLCCSFQDYLHCSERVVNTTCGYETARFTKNFLDRMSGPLIQGHCQHYERSDRGCFRRHHHQSHAENHWEYQPRSASPDNQINRNNNGGFFTAGSTSHAASATLLLPLIFSSLFSFGR